MTGRQAVTTCTGADRVENIPELDNGIRYQDSDFTMNSALQHRTNISITEICAKWSVLSGTDTYTVHL